MKERVNKRIHKQQNNIGIIISSTLVLIILSLFLYNKLTETKSVVNGEIEYQSTKIKPEFLLTGQYETLNINEIRLDNKIIFKLDNENILKKIEQEFTTGRKEIILLNENVEIIAKDTILIDEFDRRWIAIRQKKDSTEVYIEIDSEPVLLD